MGGQAIATALLKSFCITEKVDDRHSQELSNVTPGACSRDARARVPGHTRKNVQTGLFSDPRCKHSCPLTENGQIDEVYTAQAMKLMHQRGLKNLTNSADRKKKVRIVLPSTDFQST